MALSFLEQLVAEWYEFRGYFVRRKINVGPSLTKFELDIVAFHPGKPHLVHIEPSMDAASWDRREKRYTAKFGAGPLQSNQMHRFLTGLMHARRSTRGARPTGFERPARLEAAWRYSARPTTPASDSAIDAKGEIVGRPSSRWAAGSLL